MASKIHSRCPLSTTTDTCFSDRSTPLIVTSEPSALHRVFVHFCLANLLRSRLISITILASSWKLSIRAINGGWCTATNAFTMSLCWWNNRMARILNLCLSMLGNVGTKDKKYITKMFGKLWKSNIYRKMYYKEREK